MSSIKIGESAEKVDVASAQVFTSKEPKADKKAANVAPRGPNLTPKSDMHVGRDWNHAQWMQAFKAYGKKLERQNYNKRSEVK